MTFYPELCLTHHACNWLKTESPQLPNLHTWSLARSGNALQSCWVQAPKSCATSLEFSNGAETCSHGSVSSFNFTHGEGQR